MPLNPVTDREFESLMAMLGPFGPGRRVVAAVSGGADSMALAVLLRRWGQPVAVVVDHGLRPASAAEAAATLDRLRALGVPSRLATLQVPPGSGLGARARAMRYDALLAACRDEGLPDLVLGHHALDQVETQTLRALAGSGADGLAGMAALAWRNDARLLRPLLPLEPARLRDTLRVAGMAWVEDPTNRDAATARGALRVGLQPLVVVPGDTGSRRRTEEGRIAAELARQVALLPGGIAAVRGELSAAAWSALVWTVSGRAHPPPRPGLARLAAAGGTLHGVCVRNGWVFREPAATAAPVPAQAGARWDGRFVLRHAVPGGTLGALGSDAARLRRRPGPPLAALHALPAVRRDGKLLAVPHMDFPGVETCPSVSVAFRPAQVLAGAAFVPAERAGMAADGGGCTPRGVTPCHSQEPAVAGGIARNG